MVEMPNDGLLRKRNLAVASEEIVGGLDEMVPRAKSVLIDVPKSSSTLIRRKGSRGSSCSSLEQDQSSDLQRSSLIVKMVKNEKISAANGDTDRQHIIEEIELVSTNFDDDDEVELLFDDNTPLIPTEDENNEGIEIIDNGQIPSVSTDIDESSWMIALQVVFPFLIAGFGTVGAGLVLDTVQHWPVFQEVSEIFILVPALLGLKGNLEMTLASRLSTQANLGRLDKREDMLNQIFGNLALVEAQAMVVAFLASTFAIALGWVPTGQFKIEHALLLGASSMATAATASFILACLMIVVVLVSRKLHINPDNVATPIAASLGDLITLGLLAFISTGLHRWALKKELLFAGCVLVFFICITPLWVYISAKNKHTRPVLIDGWPPVIFSMLISSAGGFILEKTVAKFHGIAVFQPVINGIGGNLVAVQASRLSTWFHHRGNLGDIPPLPGDAVTATICLNPCRVMCASDVHSRASRVLLILVVPGQLIFMYMIHFLRAGHTTITPLFALVYLSAAVIQVSLLLLICAWMVRAMWKKRIDPDNHAIPYLTALGDLLGTALLAIAFHILYTVGDRDSDVGE